MSDEVQIILDLSPAAQQQLDRYNIDLARELQRELPSLRLRISYQADPAAPAGRKDIATILQASAAVVASVAALVTAVRPIILRIMDSTTPPTQSTTWTIEERPDGTRIRRLQVYSSRERRDEQSQPEPPAIDKP
jgi:hypothetical protein